MSNFPDLRLPGPVSWTDKVVHASAFGLLAFLFWRFAQAMHDRISRHFVWVAAVILTLYAIIDEWHQQFVGRGTDLTDGLADLVGIAIALTALELRRRAVAAREAGGKATPLESAVRGSLVRQAPAA